MRFVDEVVNSLLREASINSSGSIHLFRFLNTVCVNDASEVKDNDENFNENSEGYSTGVIMFWNLGMIMKLGNHLIENKTVGRNIEPSTIEAGKAQLAIILKIIMRLIDQSRSDLRKDMTEEEARFAKSKAFLSTALVPSSGRDFTSFTGPLLLGNLKG